MSLIVRAPEEKFPTAPEGTFAAVCVDVIDLGMVENRFDADRPTHKIRIVWQIAEDQEDGTPHRIRHDYTASLHEKAKLRKDLQAWRGKAFLPEELAGFDLENLIGAPCLLSIAHNTGSKGGTFANVSGVMKLAKGMTVLAARDYVRVKDRPVNAAPALVSQPKQRPVPVEEQPADTGEWDRYHGVTDDDVPFNCRPQRGGRADKTVFQMWASQAANQAVANALRSGRLQRQTCETCGEKAEAHHADYSKPLEVRWLCLKTS